MPVVVMHIGRVWMSVFQSVMPVSMRVRLSWRISGFMRMLVMLVMNVRVRMHHRQVDMLVFMALREMQPNA